MKRRNQYYRNRDDDDYETNKKISKSLSWLLRHGAISQNIKIDEGGWVLINDVLNWKNMKNRYVDSQKIEEIVQSDNKSRYELDGDYIRASQGHTMKTIKDEKLLQPIKDGKNLIAVHGTQSDVWPLIFKTGLNKMARNHIHFAPAWPGDEQIISGMRQTCDCLIEVDIQKSLKDGVKWFMSTNKVILTRGFNGVLPPKYFKKVVLRGQTIIRDGIVLNKELEYIFVLDFEAQCLKDKRQRLKCQEIVEFPIVVIDVKAQKIIEEFTFHYYIKPVVHPEITDFCTELTGITQDMVNKGVSIEKALVLFDEHLKKIGLQNKNWVFMTCGDWDLQTCLRNEAKYKKLNLADYFHRWINIKKVFPTHKYRKVAPGQKNKVRGMKDMLKMLGIKLEGRHHSGIDDTRNIAACALQLIKDGFIYKDFHINRVKPIKNFQYKFKQYKQKDINLQKKPYKQQKYTNIKQSKQDSWNLGKPQKQAKQSNYKYTKQSKEESFQQSQNMNTGKKSKNFVYQKPTKQNKQEGNPINLNNVDDDFELFPTLGMSTDQSNNSKGKSKKTNKVSSGWNLK